MEVQRRNSRAYQSPLGSVPGSEAEKLLAFFDGATDGLLVDGNKTSFYQDAGRATEVASGGQEILGCYDISAALRSGAARHGVGLTTTAPTFKTDGTLEKMTFVTGDYLDFAGAVVNSSRTVVMALNTTGGDSRRCFMSAFDTGNPAGQSYSALTLERNSSGYLATTIGSTTVEHTGAVLPENTDVVISMTYDRDGTGDVALRIDGVEVATGNVATPSTAGGSGGVRLFSHRALTGRQTAGDLSFAALAFRNVSGTELTDIEAIAAARQGRTL